jgi:putative cardiolipin synthase
MGRYVIRRVSTYPLIVALAALIISGCATLPSPPPTSHVYSLPPAESGMLAEVSSRFNDVHGPEESGFLLLTRNDEALKWRLALIDHAVFSIDAQYFIWQDDEAGRFLFDRLLKAAGRGVRVRLLVDDMLFAPRDRTIAAICRHPNLDIKIFNPGRVRDSTLGAYGEFLLYFRELNRRMHNKLFVVDNRLAIVGGRNIGNAYFGLSEKYNFQDLDVLVVGPVIEEVSHAFDEYWNADRSYPGSAMSSKATIEELQSLREWMDEYLISHRDVLASYPMEPVDWKESLAQLPSLMEVGEAHFLQDVPMTFDGEEHRLADMLVHLAEPNHKELIIITPYLIPMGDFLENVAQLSSEGVKIKILTGSMGANNHTVAHSHYKKYRRSILATGAELYEFRHDPSSAVRAVSDVPPIHSGFISLHIKAIVGDRKRCFVGSLNLDPRALRINTENGLYIQSPGLSKQLAEHFDTLMTRENAWQVYLDMNDKIRWKSSTGNVSRQPARSFRQRIADFFFRLLPIESQL